jgi:outer membrane protein TolC
VREAQAGLALAVTRTYARGLAAQAAQAATAAAVTAAEADLARATNRRDAGTATEADVLALSVHLADVRQRTIAAFGDAAIARAELNHLMDVPIDRDYVVQEPPPPAPGTIALDLQALLQEAGAARPELTRAAMAVRLAELAVRATHAAWYPEIAAEAGYGLSGDTFSGRASSWIVGANLRWTISTGGAELASSRAATAGVTQARAAYDEARATVDVEVVTAVRRRESAIARAAVGQAAEREARESQRIIRDRYEAGLATVNDVLRAATAVLDADAQRVSALVDALASDAELQHALGRAAAPVSR